MSLSRESTDSIQCAKRGGASEVVLSVETTLKVIAILLCRSGCVVGPLRSFPAPESDICSASGGLTDQTRKVTPCLITP